MKKLLASLFCFVFFLGVSLVFGGDKPAPQKAPVKKPAKKPAKKATKKTAKISQKEKIKKLIAGLGNASFAVREQSTKALEKIGKPALSYLRSALKSKEPEVQWRARTILQHIEGLGKTRTKTTVPKETEPAPRGPQPPIRFRFGFKVPGAKKFWKEFNVNPKSLKRLFTFRDFQQFQKELELRFRQLEKLLRKGFGPQGFKFGPQGFKFGPQGFKFGPKGFEIPKIDPRQFMPPRLGPGQGRGTFKIYRFNNGKKTQSTWRYRNGKWEKVTKGQKTTPRPPTMIQPSNPYKLGVLVEPLKPTLRYHLGLGTQGLLVKTITKNSRAQQAGMVKYDIILEVNGQSISRVDQLQRIIKNTGKKALKITIFRQGKKIQIIVPAVGSKKKKTKRKFF